MSAAQGSGTSPRGLQSAGAESTQTNYQKRPNQNVAVDNKFNLEKTKARIAKGLEDTAPMRFRHFFKSALLDRFLHTAILYFVSRFQYDALQRRAKRNSPDKNLEAARVETEGHLQELAPIYAQIIMQESDYEHTQQDKLFFESLYESTNMILQEAFSGQRKQKELEEELGRIFRTNQFNIACRRNQKRLNDGALSIRELYQLKHEGDPALNSRILASLYPKRDAPGSVQLASASNSPIIAKMIPSPRETKKKGDKKAGDHEDNPQENTPSNGNNEKDNSFSPSRSNSEATWDNTSEARDIAPSRASPAESVAAQ
mmetsp:Transcript_29504/g.35836  ORF Transcript_29504/g.35836 Transcript_29504/m.35836 type:complete len:315 (-) Transcript_29504:533-1477(-)|eukprot:CAMPEP_0197853232 /NCGR_PEP_ID=MMETSP1438-20131217/22343_1 /TAXON_ID=1461541 /ORGANISM="Pterosperma sp., Strain CCMP1384" /LENGTH=314 /DNA_ID=CAMNT_0043467563 /DNA_START=362 /DNA_END=1306 /DNA_ORIENTATION=+